MKKLLTAVVSLLVAISVYASSEWVLIAKSLSGDTYFIDINSVDKRGEVYIFWMRTNYVVKLENGAMSVKTQDAVNCSTREVQMRYATAFSRSNNTGNVLFSKRVVGEWIPVAPDSIHDGIFKHFCD